MGGLSWADPVQTSLDLATCYDETGTARFVLDKNFGYVKDGSDWIPFLSRGSEETDAPPVIHTSVVDRLGELSDA
jgi:hypothetical protein